MLVGGGHAHVEVLRSFAMRPLAGARLTLVTPGPEMIYSGMLPGRIAGHYSHEDCVIDLVALCRAAGAVLVPHAAIRLDLAEKRLLVAGGGQAPYHQAPYDILSLDIGIVPKLDAIAGADRHAIAVKPIGDFEAKWLELQTRCLAPEGPRRMLVIGGGAAGFELILAVRHALVAELGRDLAAAARLSFTLISDTPLLGADGKAARRAAEKALEMRRIRLLAGRPAVRIEAGGAVLDDGSFVPADAVFVATQAQLPPWLREAGLRLDAEGFVAVGPSLQTLDEEGVFAVGDCAGMVASPRPKAGVYAVRQGPILAANLRRFVLGEALLPYHPQRRRLMLLGLGEEEAIALWGPFAAKGKWAWRWKQHIDRGWIARYRVGGALFPSPAT
ncbi:selenide, water dikinase [Rhizobiales bacterium GAS113]|nr:selenide, water dikinase [Rhizobiales bacterium GAS113]